MKIILIIYTLNENSKSYHVVNVASCEKNEHLFVLFNASKTRARTESTPVYMIDEYLPVSP